jgi:aconitate hydratase A / 2-methylisocitrate dehydratase
MSNFQSKIEVETTANSITKIYEKLQNKISILRKATDRPLTISEKILIGHLAENIDFNSNDVLVRGKSYVILNPDRVALQDVTGQMTILQFMLAGLKRTAVPTTVHCDHLIQARIRSDLDTKAALYENNEGINF